MLPLQMLCGAAANRIRGGWFDGATAQEGGAFLAYGKAINVFLFAAMVWACTGSVLLAVMCGVGMYGGQSFGWGRYVGALGGWEDKELREVAAIDVLIRWMRPKAQPMFVANPNEEQRYHYDNAGWLMAWGFAGLCLRGAVWGLCLAVPMMIYGLTQGQNNLAPALTVIAVGASMGLVYATAIHTYKNHPLAINPRGLGWQAGELYFGAILWGGFVASFL